MNLQGDAAAIHLCCVHSSDQPALQINADLSDKMLSTNTPHSCLAVPSWGAKVLFIVILSSTLFLIHMFTSVHPN